MLGLPYHGKLHTVSSEPAISSSPPEPIVEPLPIHEVSEDSLLAPPSPHASVNVRTSNEDDADSDDRSRHKFVMTRASRVSYMSFCECFLSLKDGHELNEHNRDLFKIQFGYVQEWFMRSSWVEKFHFLVLLVEESSDIKFLKTLLQSLRAGNAKDLIYSTNQNINAFYYDIVPEDDNRAMDYRTLVKVQMHTRHWFVHLVDSEKLEVFVGLISLSGGALLREVYLRVSIVLAEKQSDETAIKGFKSVEVVAKLSQRLGITMKTAMELSKEVEMHGDTIVPIGVETEMQSTDLATLEETESKSGTTSTKSGSATSKKNEKRGKKKKAKEEKERRELENETGVSTVTKKTYTTHFGEEFELEATPGEHLLALSIEKFNQKMAETRLSFGLDEDLQPIAKANPKQADKGKKNKKNKKNKKSDSKKEKTKVEVLDEIQLLPLWANRPIMMQLNDDELAHKKKVSRYWAAMIDEVHREQIIREDLDDTIEKYTQLLGPSTTRATSPVSQGKSKKKDKKGKDKGKKGDAKGKKGKKVKNKGNKRPHLLSVEGEVLELFQPDPPLGEEATREMIGAALISKESPQMTNIYQGRHCIAKVIQDFLHSRVMACCPRGRLMAISSRNRVVEFYSLLSGCQLTPRLVGHSSIITCMAFHDDGDHIMTGSLDTTVRLWNIWARRAVKIYLGHFRTVSSLSLSKDFLATGGYDKTIKVFHIWSGQCLMTAHEDHTVTAVVLSPDARLVYTGCRSGHLCAFNSVTGEHVHKVAGHEKGITCLFLSPPLLASAGKDGFARLWNTTPLGPSCLIAMDHGRAVTAVSISHMRVITGCESGRMRVWCALSGQLLKLMRVSPTTRPIRDLHCIEEVDHAKIVVSAETGVKIYEFDPLTAPKNKRENFSRVVNVKPSHSKFLLDLNKRARVQFSPKPSLSGWQEVHGRDIHSADEHDAQVKASLSGIELHNMRNSKMEDLERRMCTDPKARVSLDNCPIVTNTFFTKIVAKHTGTIFSEAPGELCEIFPRRKPERTNKYRLPLHVPTWEEYCQKLKINPTKHSGKKPQVKPSHKNLLHLYQMQRLSI